MRPPINVSESVRKLNPHIYGGVQAVGPPPIPAKPAKRIRQSEKKLLNKLEEEWFAILKNAHPTATIRAQSKRYRLGNGIWYKPDFTAIIDGIEYAWEVKGPHAFRGGFENLKVAAGLYQEIVWILVWKDSTGDWVEQDVLA